MNATQSRRDMVTATAMTGAVALSVSIYDLAGVGGPPAARYAVAALGLLLGIATARASFRGK